MKPMLSVFTDAALLMRNVSLEAPLELFMFFSAMAAYYILHQLRLKHCNHFPKQEDDAQCQTKILDPTELDAALRAACEASEHYDVVKYWNAFKQCDQAPNVQLPQVVTAMRACKMSPESIVHELLLFFQKHPSRCDMSNVNEILSSLAEQRECQLAELVVDILSVVDLALDSTSYEILLAMHVKCRQASKAQSILAEAKANDLPLTGRGVFFALKASINVNDFDQALCYFKDLKVSWLASATSEPVVPQHVMAQLMELACNKRQNPPAVACARWPAFA